MSRILLQHHQSKARSRDLGEVLILVSLVTNNLEHFSLMIACHLYGFFVKYMLNYHIILPFELRLGLMYPKLGWNPDPPASAS